MLEKYSQFNLINAANLASGLLSRNWVKSRLELFKFKYQSTGLPILLEADKNVFEFSKADIFELSDEDICYSIYRHKDTSYVGFQHAFKGNQFLSDFRIRSDFKEKFDLIVKQNQGCLSNTNRLRNVYSKVGAFQTRNVPHSGHEAIIEEMLNHCDHLVINPVVGPKKKDDITLQALELVFEYLAKEKYNSRISFYPIFANMFYAGPLEALHHAILRERLGFSLFSVGRDHAGAEGMYQSNEAVNYIQNCSKKLNIRVFCHSGAGFCRVCRAVKIKDKCPKDHIKFNDISGTLFRECIKRRVLFDFADVNMQTFLYAQPLEVFEKL